MRLLVVDDDRNLRRMLTALLEPEGYLVDEAGSAEEGLSVLSDHRPEAVLLDLVLPGDSGLDALPRYLERLPGVPIIMMSGEATLSDAVTATRAGAFHFLEKPLSPESVLVTLRAALEVGRARALTRVLQEEFGPGTLLVGDSPAMQRVRDTIERVAPTEARVLITGESGTGKELAATAIHGLSERSGGPFVRVNSAAIPRELVESEMFGHERGAFTGANSRRRGRFELAHGGTLFLDEVADLGPEAQSKLLRALESGSIQRVGGTNPISVDVRVLAATNRDLRSDTDEGLFREDLLFRLEVVPLRMPPIRERLEDLPLLVDHIANRLRIKHGLTPPTVSGGALDVLAAHPWPGNVRELLNFMERLAILHPGETVRPEDVSRFLGSPRPGSRRTTGVDHGMSLTDRLAEVETELIQSAISEAGGNVSEAARALQTDRANLYRRMRRLGIQRGESS